LFNVKSISLKFTYAKGNCKLRKNIFASHLIAGNGKD